MADSDESTHACEECHLITVTGTDGPGLVAAISEVIAGQGADIEDVTMTRLSGNFAAMLVARGGDHVRLAAELAECGRSHGLFVHVEPAIQERPVMDEANVYVNAAGPNKVGIVAALSRVLAAHCANITEMSTRLLSRTEVPTYLVRIEACAQNDLASLSNDLFQTGKQIGIDVRVEPLERTDL